MTISFRGRHVPTCIKNNELIRGGGGGEALLELFSRHEDTPGLARPRGGHSFGKAEGGLTKHPGGKKY